MNVKKFEAGPGEVENTWKSLLAIRVSLFICLRSISMREVVDVLPVKRPSSSRTRAIFIEKLSGPMLQMLGTKYVLLFAESPILKFFSLTIGLTLSLSSFLRS